MPDLLVAVHEYGTIRTFASEYAENPGELPNRDTGLFRLSNQRVIGAVVKHYDPRAIDPVVFDFQDRAVEKLGRHLLDGKSDGLGGRGKAAIADRAPTMPAAGRKQVGWRVIIESGH